MICVNACSHATEKQLLCQQSLWAAHAEAEGTAARSAKVEVIACRANEEHKRRAADASAAAEEAAQAADALRAAETAAEKVSQAQAAQVAIHQKRVLQTGAAGLARDEAHTSSGSEDSNGVDR